VKPALAHAENIRDGFAYVRGGAARAGGRAFVVAPFYVRRTEVTNIEFKVFVARGGYDRDDLWDVDAEARKQFIGRDGSVGPRNWTRSTFPEGEGLHPVRYVSWHEARAFARFSGGDLPTEEQWMFAAGWSMARPDLEGWPWGASFDPAMAWVGKGPELPATVPVGSFPSGASPSGCLDMAGNVSEWVLDRFGPAGSDYRILKGGDSSDFDFESRSSILSREWCAKEAAHPLSGFRVVRKGFALE